MIAFYAMGGGLGHLRRARSFLDAFAPGSQGVFFTASRFASGDDVIHVPRSLDRSPRAFGQWLGAELRSLRPSAIVVDAFPLGILGELADPSVLPDVPLYHVARLLRWDAYSAAFPGRPRRFEASYAVEQLAPRHEAALRRHSKRVEPMELELPASTPLCDPLDAHRVAGRPLWLVVHSGPRSEVRELLGLARQHRGRDDPKLLVVSPRHDLELDAEQMHYEPASDLFPFAERVVTACGFNTMRELDPYADRHLFKPFARRFDHQVLRAARRQRADRMRYRTPLDSSMRLPLGSLT